MSTRNRNRNRKGNKKPKAATTSKGFDASKGFDSSLSMGAAPAKAKAPQAKQAKAPAPAPVVADERFSAEQNELRALVGACVAATDTASATLAAEAFAEAAANMGVAALGAAEITEMLASKAVLASKNKVVREAGVLAVAALVAKLGAPCVGALMAIVPTVLALTGDKKGPDVRAAAATATLAIFDVLPNEAVPVYIQECILKKKTGGLASLARPETKVTALKLLSAAAKKAPREVEGMMTTLVPVVSKAMWDVKKVVKEQAEETLEDICGSIDNIDITPFIPNLVDAIADPETVPDCIYSLAGTTFVQTVTASALSITVPLLKRGFNDKKTAIKRKCAVITENMAKLVKNPARSLVHAVLQPLLAKGIREIADPECRAPSLPPRRSSAASAPRARRSSARSSRRRPPSRRCRRPRPPTARPTPLSSLPSSRSAGRCACLWATSAKTSSRSPGRRP